MLMEIVTTGGMLLLLLSLAGGAYSWYRKALPPTAPLPQPISLVTLVLMAVLGGIGASTEYALFYARPGMSYLVQYPWGTQKAVLTPGFHLRWFGETIAFKKFLTVAFGADDGGYSGYGGTGFSGAAPVQSIRFHDSVTADVRMTARFEMPRVEDQFLPMAIAFRSQSNLINSSLIPIMQEAMRNAGRMYSAQEYIGGKGGDFENAVLDQIRNGIFLLDINEERISRGAQSITQSEARTIQQDQTVRIKVKVRLDKNGLPMRKDAGDHPLKKFGLTLVQANVQDVDPDPAFKDKLKEQREAAAQVAIERQNARKEEERKKRIIAQGEAEKASKQIELEKAQIERVIAAETKAKEAQQEQQERLTRAQTLKKEADVERERKEIELQTARLEAERQLELAQADAKARTLRMKADNALQQRLEAYTEVSKAYAYAMKDKQLVPRVMIVNGAGANGGALPNGSDLITLLMGKLANDLAVQVKDVNASTSK